MPEVSQYSDELHKQISYVSHEIRNNISICDMYAQILKRRLQNEGIYNDDFSQSLNCIENSLQLITANLTELKALNNSEKHICDIKELLLASIRMSKAYVDDKNIDFKVNVSESVNVFADENKLLSCFVNILKNAIEAIEIKGVISISLRCKSNNAIIHFSNSGIPIEPKIRDKVFNYGFTSKDFGSGFGLCLTKEYIESQNGQINLLKSDETTFEIVISIAF